MPKLACTICAAPSDVLAAVNAALKDGTKLRDLEKRTRFSRSTLSRHHRACVPRETLNSYRRFNPNVDRAHVVWPGQEPPANMGPGDVILKVVYEKINPRTIGNCRAVMPTPEHLAVFAAMALEEDEQRTNSRLLDPSLEKDFDLLWLWAHEEDCARTANKPKSRPS